MSGPRGSLKRKGLDVGARQLPVLPDLPAGGRYPCDSCPLNKPHIEKVKPLIPPDPLFGMVGTATGLKDSQPILNPFAGETGKLLREELEKVGLSASRMAFFNLTRCRPEKGGKSPEWLQAVENCWSFLEGDLAGSYPLILLGAITLKKVMRDKGANFNRTRGMWCRAPGNRHVFPTWHHAKVMTDMYISSREGMPSKKLRQFRADLRRAADRILGRERLPPVSVDVFKSPWEAETFLSYLARHKRPWAFDIETFDAAEPRRARENVATDPFHPDFRIRGVSIAWAPDRGAWIELAPWESEKERAATLLGPAFASPAEKMAFHGSFDENGLVYNRWVPRIANRVGDGMLALVSINAGGHEGLSLERAVVEILEEPQWWGMDKLGIGAAPMEDVANSSVRDSCNTLKLEAYLRPRLESGDYIVPEEEEE